MLNTPQVEFIGEEGVDSGGLTREFFQILFQQIASVYLDSTGCFKHNAVAFQVSDGHTLQTLRQNNLYFLQENVFSRLGQFASMCLVHGGAAVRVFSSSVYSFLCGMKPSDIIADISEVSNFETRDFIAKVRVRVMVSVATYHTCTAHTHAPTVFYLFNFYRSLSVKLMINYNLC